ncbi:MAG TPA: hypothetical protein VMU15_07355 [Anaeromyxobacter sp.]|nr:hypothetical protein [Anaeromyxobacter sp.]
MPERAHLLAHDASRVRDHRARALELVQQAEAAADPARASAFRAIAAQLEVRALELDAEAAALFG